MFEDLFIASTMHLIGHIFFGQFEERTSKLRKLTKVAFLLGITALLSSTVGRPWSLLWVVGMFSIGMTFHVWWTIKHGINPWTAEPREKYYALRGWKV